MAVEEARWRRLLLLALVAEAVLLAGLVKSEVTHSGNETTRLATAERLVDAGTFALEGSPFRTVDRARIGGRFYSDKPLLLSVWLAGVYWPLAKLAGWTFADRRGLAILLVTFLGVTVWSLALSALFAARLRRRGAPPLAAAALGVAVVVTTWLLTFGTTVNNHTPAAVALFALVMALERAQREPGLAWPLVAGVLAGVLAALEIPTGAVFALVGVAVLAASSGEGATRARSIGAFAAGGLAVAAVVAAIDVVAYGHPLPAYLVPGAFDFPGNIHTTRLAGLHRPLAAGPYLWTMLFGSRGVFSHQPALLLAIPFLVRWRRLPAIERACAGGVVALVAFYATNTGDLGGWAYGFRFLVPVVPLLFWWGACWALDGGRTRHVVFASLATIGLVTSWIGAWNPWPVVYEGAATARGAVEHHVRSPLLANVLVRSFERDADGPVFQRLAAHYGARVTAGYLQKAAVNLRRPDLMGAATAWARRSLPAQMLPPRAAPPAQ